MTDDDPDTRLRGSADELEERLGRLGDQIGEAEQKAQERSSQDVGEAGDPAGEEAVGDFEDVHDEAGGEDPSGAGEDKDDARS